MSMKKGWRRYGAAVVFLVMLSMLVPLVFLLGLYGGFQTGYANEGGPPTLNQTGYSRALNSQEHEEALHQTEGNHSRHLGDHVSGFEFPLSKESKDGVATNHSKSSMNDQEKTGVLAKVGLSVHENNISGITDGHLDKGAKMKHPNSGGTHVRFYELQHILLNVKQKIWRGYSLEAGALDLNFCWNLARNAGLPKKSGASSLSGTTVYNRKERKQSERPAHTDSTDELEKACQVSLGSYCIWSSKHREEMADSMVKTLKDQLFLARAYYPSIIKRHNREKIQHELRQHIQDSEHILSVATTDDDLPEGAHKKAKSMEGALAKVKSYPVDCNNVIKKLGQILDSTEEEANFHRKQGVYLYQLAVQTMPKSLHCLSMRLTVEYFQTYKEKSELLLSEKLEDLDLYHYVVYSTNILAASVVVNSTVIHAKESEKHVFHLITDMQNYAAMKVWFLMNTYGNATVHVQNLDDLNGLHSSNSTMASLSSEEFRVAVESPTKNSSDSTGLNKKLEYLSVFNHPHFQLPEIFPKLNKVLFLDDDVVVQRDLTHLWSIDLQGKVNGAVETCEVRFHHLKKYLRASKFFENGFDGSVCAWMSGMNIIDLQQWKKQDLTKIYKRWLKLQNKYNVPWRFGTLPASLITFYNMTHALDNSWVSFGLGHNFGIDQLHIENSAVLHYNGNMKPWLEIGISEYKPYWASFLKQDDQFMLECNVNG